MLTGRSPVHLIALTTLLVVVAVAVNVTWRRGTPRRFNSATEARDALLGKTAEEVRSLGEPDRKSFVPRDNPQEIWEYDHVFREPLFVHFDGAGKVSQVDQYRPDVGPRQP